jgi:hypothetical protein
MKLLKSSRLFIYTTLFFLLFGFASNKQLQKIDIGEAILQDGWITYDTINQVAILYRVADCDDHQNGVFSQELFFKLENLNKESKNIRYSLKLWTAGKISQDGLNQEHIKTLSIKAGQTLEADCKENSDLKVFIGFNDKDKLTIPRLSHFQFAKFQVESQK